MQYYQVKDLLEYLKVQNEWVVVDIETNEAYQINQTLKYILESCQEPRTSDQVYQYLRGLDAWDAEGVQEDEVITPADVVECLEELLALGLVRVHEAYSVPK